MANSKVFKSLFEYRDELKEGAPHWFKFEYLEAIERCIELLEQDLIAHRDLMKKDYIDDYWDGYYDALEALIGE